MKTAALIFIVFILNLIVSFYVHAQGQYFQVKEGQKLEVDAAVLSKTAEFRFVMLSDDDSDLKFKIKNRNGFECQVLSSELVKKEEWPSWPAQLTYQILVNWSPGADLSGCEIQIIHPSMSSGGEIQASSETSIKINMNF